MEGGKLKFTRGCVGGKLKFTHGVVVWRRVVGGMMCGEGVLEKRLGSRRRGEI